MLAAAVVQRSQYVSRRLAENREASNAASARRNNVFRSSRRSGRTGRAQGRSSFGLPDGTGGSQSLNPNLVQWYDEGGGGEDGNGEGDDIASRVVYGLPETTNFSGSSDYPFSNFVDPENEWDEDGAGTHQPEPQQPSEEQDGVFDPAIFFDAESDEEDNGDNWSEKQVENEFRQYWETGKTWKKERVVWLNACVTKRNGLSLKEHDSLNKKAVLFKDLKKKKKEKEEGGGGRPARCAWIRLRRTRCVVC